MPPTLISSRLVHKIRQPAESGADIHPALILLHGRGTNEDDFLGLEDYVDPRFFIVSVRAPYKYEEGFGGYTWYDVQDVGLDIEYPIPHTISEQSLNDLSDWLEKKLAVPEDRK